METKIIYVDSDNRDIQLYPSGANYTLHLTDQIKNVSRVDLISAKVPNTIWNLTGSSNVLRYNSQSMNISPGFYSATGIQNEIQCRLPVGANVTWLSNEGKFLFTSPNLFTLSVNNASLATMLGFTTSNTYTASIVLTDPVYSQILPVNSFFIKSDTIVDFAMNQFLFLDIQELRNPRMVEALALARDRSGTYTGKNARNTFAMIPMNVISGCSKTFTENGDYIVSIEYPQPIEKLSRLTVTWTDDNGNIVNFNGHETNSFVLRIWTEQKKPLPAPPPLQDVEIKRIIDAMTTLPKPKEPEKRALVGRWTIWILFLIVLAGYIIYKTFIRPNSTPGLPHRLAEMAPGSSR